MRTLEGNIAVVTGGTSGVGRGIASALAQYGARVFVTGRSARDGAPVDDSCTARVESYDLNGRGGLGIRLGIMRMSGLMVTLPVARHSLLFVSTGRKRNVGFGSSSLADDKKVTVVLRVD